jgi:hypothetical protein
MPALAGPSAFAHRGDAHQTTLGAEGAAFGPRHPATPVAHRYAGGSPHECPGGNLWNQAGTFRTTFTVGEICQPVGCREKLSRRLTVVEDPPAS